MWRYNTEKLSTLVRSRRANLTLRDAATESGVSASTLSRVENGKNPDMESFLQLCNWLNIEPAKFFGNEQVNQSVDLATIIETDDSLQPEISKALAVIVRRLATS